MTQRIEIDVPMNRVEGDLEIKVAMEDGVVVDAWSVGTLYRGFENILRGRDALDALVITPRVCGICGTAHLASAVKALEMAGDITPPANAVRLRNVSLAAECLQNDVRQAFLMYTPDFTSERYRDSELFEEAVRRYQPFEGDTVREVLRESKHAIEIVAIIGGQWPHSSYMVPGGICTIPTPVDLAQCRHLASGFQRWYERRILGGTIADWRTVQSRDDLDSWLQEPNHAASDLGFFIRFCRAHGIDQLGRGHDRFLSFGCYDDPDNADTPLIPGAYIDGADSAAFDQRQINEHVHHSWFKDYGGGRHPYEGETTPERKGVDDHRYTWAKAPRYGDAPVETGALAEQLALKDPLFVDLVQHGGANAYVRMLARMTRPARLLPSMLQWLEACLEGGDYYENPGPIQSGQGHGLVHAARGALGHWMHIEDGNITGYQIITPTAWNGSPRDSQGQRGPWEQALIGARVEDPADPIELGHIIRSFDPCLVCTVHAFDGDNTLSRYRLAV